jgi:DNA-binding CsgD family transcriptional regulator
VLAPHGYEGGDELRATFLDGDEAWGCVALHRRHGWFQEHEADAIASVGAYVAEGIRRAILVSSLATSDTVGAPSLILLDADNVIESITPAGASCIRELFDTTSASTELPLVMVAVAERARRASAGDTVEVASARLPTVAGGWILAHASVLSGGTPGRVGIILSPTRQPEIAALIVAAHGLSVREREVTRLVLCGLTTDAIASDLQITPYTVQDHLKSIFTKVGVSSRRELVAHLFQQHYAPRLLSGASVGPSGWFAEAPPEPHQ